MSKVLLQVPVDEALKRDADSLFVRLGLDTQTAIRIFLKQAVACNGFPFEVKRAGAMQTLAAMNDVKEGRGLVGPFYSAEDMMASVMEAEAETENE